MSDFYPVSDATRSHALIDAESYDEMYKRSVEDPEGFWAEQAERIDWIKPFTKVKDASFAGLPLRGHFFGPSSLATSLCFAANFLGQLLQQK